MNPYDPAEPINDEETLQQTRLLLEALDAFTRSESWAEAKYIVEQHRELLSDEADALLLVLIARQEDERAVEILQEHRRVLMHCRDAGIEAAFAGRIPEQHDHTPPDIDPLIWERMRNADSYEALLALVFEYPELMPLIKNQVEQVLGGSQMAIVNAIEAFLRVASWDEARMVIDEHPELLTLDADIWLVQYADFMNEQGEVGIAEIVSNRRWLLARCRMYGTARVFEGSQPAPDGTRLDVAPELLEQLLAEE